jgi:hypothetical protein
MRMLLIGFALLLGALNAEAACPVGSYPWVDNWETKYVIRLIQWKYGRFKEVLQVPHRFTSMGR